jgi:hypothetical protein
MSNTINVNHIDQWLVWSNEHRAWWAPGGSGYVRKSKDAGRYSFREASEICHAANHGQSDGPMETMVSVHDMPCGED